MLETRILYAQLVYLPLSCMAYQYQQDYCQMFQLLLFCRDEGGVLGVVISDRDGVPITQGNHIYPFFIHSLVPEWKFIYTVHTKLMCQ